MTTPSEARSCDPDNKLDQLTREVMVARLAARCKEMAARPGRPTRLWTKEERKAYNKSNPNSRRGGFAANKRLVKEALQIEVDLEAKAATHRRWVDGWVLRCRVAVCWLV